MYTLTREIPLKRFPMSQLSYGKCCTDVILHLNCYDESKINIFRAEKLYRDTEKRLIIDCLKCVKFDCPFNFYCRRAAAASGTWVIVTQRALRQGRMQSHYAGISSKYT